MYTYSAKRRGEISEPVSVVQQGVSVSLSVDVKEINLAEAGEKNKHSISHVILLGVLVGVPEWLTVSSTNGVGNAAIKVSANSLITHLLIRGCYT